MRSSGEKQRMCGIGGAAEGRGEGPARAEGRAEGTGFRIRPLCPDHRRSLDLCLRMGHCAPAVMAALIADDDPGRDGAVLAASAMAGGIGNCGRECGALTSSILYLGDRYGIGPGPDGVPTSIALSRQFVERFGRVHGGTTCNDIRRGGKNPLPCMRAMVSAPEIAADIIREAGSPATEESLSRPAARLLSSFGERGFHCAHAVLAGLSDTTPEFDRLWDMTYPFVGGIALSGTTCSAAAAGVMAIGLATGKIEDSKGRVFAMMARMISGGDMMDDTINNFNPAINRGQGFMEWFVGSYGTASCRELTDIDVADGTSVERYLSSGGIDRCIGIAGAVATKVREIIEKV